MVQKVLSVFYQPCMQHWRTPLHDRSRVWLIVVYLVGVLFLWSLLDYFVMSLSVALQVALLLQQLDHLALS
jgi:hypothetical protein